MDKIHLIDEIYIMEKNGKYGIVNMQTAEEILPYEYKEYSLDALSIHMVYLRIFEGWKIFNLNTKEFLTAMDEDDRWSDQIEMIDTFDDVSGVDDCCDFMICKRNGKLGAFNFKGESVVAPICDDIDSYFMMDGLKAIEGESRYLIDNTGIYEYIHNEDATIIVQDNIERVIIIDSEVIDIWKYSSNQRSYKKENQLNIVEENNNGIYKVKNSNGMGVVQISDGFDHFNIILQCKYDEIILINDEFGILTMFIIEKEGYYGLLDMKEKTMIPVRFTDIQFYKMAENKIGLVLDYFGKKGFAYIDFYQKGKMVYYGIACDYDRIELIHCIVDESTINDSFYTEYFYETKDTPTINNGLDEYYLKVNKENMEAIYSYKGELVSQFKTKELPYELMQD